MSKFAVSSALLGVAAGAAALVGCTTLGELGSLGGLFGSTTTNELSSTDQAAIEAFLSSTESLTTSVTSTQGSTAGQSGGQTALSITVSDTCPSATFTASNDGSAELGLTIDFGSGCSPFGSSAYFCSGSASGTFSQANSNINVTFNALSCNGKSLSGDVNLDFVRTSTVVDLSGEWNVTYTDSAGSVNTAGSGQVEFNRSDANTVISAFDGTLTQGGAQYGCELDQVEVSFAQYENFIPYGGTATLTYTDGGDDDQMVITFNANSPSTGVVSVTLGVNATTTFNYNLFTGEVVN